MNRRTGRKSGSPATGPRRGGDGNRRATTNNQPTSPAQNAGVPNDEFMSQGPEPEFRPGQVGEQLRHAIDKQAIRDCDKIAKALSDKANAGDVRALGLLFNLTGANNLGNQKAKRRHPPILPWRAATLEAEPDWKGPTEAEEDKMYAETLGT
ncbi:MAG: hypothetical protein ABSD67_19710 [Terracidiphilus sp.]